jgi:hypothetical protein
MKTLSINNARIMTATVDIQVVRIGAKQMTLAVFRQLPHKNIFDESGNLLTYPWGWVNYDRDDGRKPFIFSFEGALYRSNVNIDQHYKLIVKASVHSERIEGHLDGHNWIPAKIISIPNGKWIITLPQECYYYWEKHINIGDFPSEPAARGHLANRLKSVAILEVAPQLFIAV